MKQLIALASAFCVDDDVQITQFIIDNAFRSVKALSLLLLFKARLRESYVSTQVRYNDQSHVHLPVCSSEAK